MNKKFLSAALAAVLAIGTVFPLAACKAPEEPEEGGPGNNQGGISGIEPGTVITDQNTVNAVMDSLSQANFKGFTYSATVNMSFGSGNNEKKQTIAAEGAALFGDKVQADLYLSTERASSEGKATQYTLNFLRGDVLYTVTEDGAEANLSSIKKQLKAESDPLLLDRVEVGETYASLIKSPAVMKLVRNLPALGVGTLTKTESGYFLSYDVLDAVEDLLEGAIGLAESVEKNAEMTLTSFFSQSFVSGLLDKLLKGITAKELKEAITRFLPEAIATALPEAGANATAAQYLESCLRSGAFYDALTGGEEDWSQWQTFGAVPLKSLVSVLTGGEVDLSQLKLKDELEKLEEGLEEQIVSLLLGFTGLEGVVDDEDIDLVLGFDFDDEKKLLGFSADVKASASVTPEQQPADNANTAAKQTARFSVKLEAACANSPELFNLTGCKYRSEDGAKPVPSAK